MPFGAPATDRYGGDRPGDNLFSSSVVAADANTGKYLWHFQVVHHDIWDADVANPPILLDIKKDGKTIPAVGIMSKSGLVFFMDRVTGKSIYGVEERPVPQSEVPLERTAKTQPFPLKPAPLSRMTMTMADIATVTPELEAACRKLVEGVQLGGPYLPVGFNRLRLQFPGNHGGVNWGGASYNPALGYMFVNTSEYGQLQGYADRPTTAAAAPAAGRGRVAIRSSRSSRRRRGRGRGGGRGGGGGGSGPYVNVPGGGRFKDEASNMMCQQPPWGNLTAINVHTGEFAWRVPLGVTDTLPPDKQNTGRPGQRRIDRHRRRARVHRRDRRQPVPRVRREDRQGALDGEARCRGARGRPAPTRAATAGSTSSSRPPAAGSSTRRPPTTASPRSRCR